MQNYCFQSIDILNISVSLPLLKPALYQQLLSSGSSKHRHMSSSFLSSHPDFTSPPSLGPLTLHHSLDGNFSNNPLEQFHFRTVQRIIKEHPEFTETYTPPVPNFESEPARKYDLGSIPNHSPSKMSGKQTMNWNGKAASLLFPKLHHHPNYPNLSMSSSHSTNFAIYRRSRREAPPRDSQSQ